ncbi:MAG: hypothetical protein HUU23_04200 [Caldilineales bacterium]|nr:hypothetical protein [Caldilineales bacterium]
MLRSFWQAWLHTARHIGNFQARALITLIYFTLIAPFGLFARLFSDPLQIKPAQNASAWHSRHTYDSAIEHAQRQG